MDELAMMSFWAGKRVFLTGHTGFKGAWTCFLLANAGAVVTGYALEPIVGQNLFSICGVDRRVSSIIGDIRDMDKLTAAFVQAKPEIVIHMAAQPIVRDGYKNPAYTYETNVMGTVNILECVRVNGGVKSFLNVTTDKVYLSREWEWGYREDDVLDGFDPYSNSKSCSELVTHAYNNSFFADRGVAISTARAGNVIGGGDFAQDRIIPDCVRAAVNNETIIVRNPHSTRPYQHVLEPICAYLAIAQRQYEDARFASCYNVGPDDGDCVTTGALVDMFCQTWGGGQSWEAKPDGGPHETHFLKLDCSRLKNVFGWRPRWHVDDAVKKTVEWTRTYFAGGDVCTVMNRQITEFLIGGKI